MAGPAFKKRARDDAPKSKASRPSKKLRKQTAYHSDSESEPGAENGNDFQAVNLLDSDEEDIHNAQVDDGADSHSDAESNGGGSTSESETPGRAPARTKKAARSIARDAPESKLARDAPTSGSDDDDDDDDDDDGDDNDSFSELDDDDDAAAATRGADGTGATKAKRTKGGKSKRSDPDAFATSMSKILNTKLSSARRADPVLARSAAAHESSRQAVDAALEHKARKRIRDQKRLAMEKGRVRDVLVATNGTFSNVNPVTGEVMDAGQTTGAILETEKRLRKVAQRGVVQLFNAFRTAQVKAAEAERNVRKEGVIGVDRKKEKVTEMSKKGFLDLIASGGGGLKKGPLEEA